MQTAVHRALPNSAEVGSSKEKPPTLLAHSGLNCAGRAGTVRQYRRTGDQRLPSTVGQYRRTGDHSLPSTVGQYRWTGDQCLLSTVQHRQTINQCLLSTVQHRQTINQFYCQQCCSTEVQQAQKHICEKITLISWQQQFISKNSLLEYDTMCAWWLLNNDTAFKTEDSRNHSKSSQTQSFIPVLSLQHVSA